MERPSLEFLGTDIFRIVQTGSRPIPNLKVYFYGNPQPNFQSNKVLSKLFGQALRQEGLGWVYLGSAGNELSFNGATSSLTSFTMGAYVLISETFGDLLLAIVGHSLGDVTPTLNKKRTSFHLTNSGFKFAQINATNLKTITPWAVPLNASGWKHVAYTYEAATAKVSLYLDGLFVESRTIDPLACCSSGAYDTWARVPTDGISDGGQER